MPHMTTLGGELVTVFAPDLNEEDHVGYLGNFEPGTFFGLDVESTYLTDLAQFDPDFRVRTVQLAPDDHTVWVFRLDDAEQRQAAVHLLADPKNSFVSHSNMDVLSVASLGIDITGRNLDTLSLARMVDPDKDRDRDLKTLATLHGMPELQAADVALYTRFKELWPGRKNAAKSEIERYGFENIALDDPVFVRYAGLDAVTVRRLAPILAALTEAPKELLHVEAFLASRANRIQIRGCRVDRPLLDEALHTVVEKTAAAKQRFADMTGVNAQAAPKLVEWFGAHGVDWSSWEGARTPKGSPSLAKENLKLLLDYPLDDDAMAAFPVLVDFKSDLDMSTKTKGLRDRLDVHDFVHPVLHPMGASTTARMSSAGFNMQNCSKKDPRMRGLFIPRPGFRFVTIDFDQVELRVVAALSGDERMIATILAGGDLHQLTVDLLAEMGIAITRDIAKIVNFLIVYGGGGKALHEQTGIPLDEAMGIVSAQRDAYPAISAYSKWIAQQRVELRTISGRRLVVTRVKGKGERAGELRTHANVNYAVQSAARELLVDAWYRFDREFGRGAYVWYPVHDELILEVPDKEVEQVMVDAERCMRFDLRGVPISATAVELIDGEGASRWMTSKLAEKFAAERVAA